MKGIITRRIFWNRALGLGAFGCIAPHLRALQTPPVASAARKRLPNPFMENGKPVVAVIHGNNFPAMLKRGMEVLGGFDRFGRNMPVHIKPNFVSPSPYPETTDGNSILTTVELLKKDGFQDITIAEWGSVLNGEQTATKGFHYYGLDRKAEGGGFKIRDLIDDETVQVKNERWIAMPGVGIRKSVYETPLIINMPSLKQHSQAQISCALKNIMGQVDRQSRNNMHRQGMRFLSENYGSRNRMSQLALAEIASAVNPELTIVDARSGLGRSHHLSGGGILIKPGRIIVSGDALAADLVAAEILEECYRGFQIEMVQSQFHHAAALGFGAETIEGIVIKESTA